MCRSQTLSLPSVVPDGLSPDRLGWCCALAPTQWAKKAGLRAGARWSVQTTAVRCTNLLLLLAADTEVGWVAVASVVTAVEFTQVGTRIGLLELARRGWGLSTIPAFRVSGRLCCSKGQRMCSSGSCRRRMGLRLSARCCCYTFRHLFVLHAGHPDIPAYVGA